ncbi:MAG: hypothetical protein ACAH27_05790 [Xanthobacteraceae bacterium]
MSKALVAVRDLVGVAAFASISYGFWLVYEPAGFIVGGALAMTAVALTVILAPKDVA